jgi:hypothetical protein
MIERATPLRLLRDQPLPSEADRDRAEQRPRAFGKLSTKDLDAAERLASFHRELVAQLPADSELRGLALRAGGHWARLAGLPRRDLRQVTAEIADSDEPSDGCPGSPTKGAIGAL